MINKTSFDRHILVPNVGMGTLELRSNDKLGEQSVERRQVKESLHRTEERFAIAFRAGPAPMASRGPKTETVLLVEDEVMLREMIKTVLAKQGYHVLEGGTGPEALQVFAQNQGKIDLLLTDIVMPGGLSGRDLAEILIGLKPNLKVIYSSGYSLELSNSSLPQHFIFLPKPYTPSKLIQTVRDCLDNVTVEA